MTLTLELTPEEEKRLQRTAQARGVDVSSLLRGLIAALPAEPDGATEQTIGQRLLAEGEAEGVLGIWQDRPDSPELAGELRHQLEPHRALIAAPLQ